MRNCLPILERGGSRTEPHACSACGAAERQLVLFQKKGQRFLSFETCALFCVKRRKDVRTLKAVPGFSQLFGTSAAAGYPGVILAHFWDCTVAYKLRICLRLTHSWPSKIDQPGQNTCESA